MTAVEWDVVRDLLVNDPVVGPLVGAGDEARVYPVRAPQDPKFPCVVLSRVSTSRDYSFDGPASTTTPTIQLDILAKSAKASREMANACRVALNGFSGPHGSDYVNGIFINTEFDEWSEPVELYRSSMTLRVAFRESLV